MASSNKLCKTQGRIKYRKSSFYYWAHPHENGPGYSYSIQMTENKKDLIHLDTAPGTIFNEQELASIREYFTVMRRHAPR